MVSSHSWEQERAKQVWKSSKGLLNGRDIFGMNSLASNFANGTHLSSHNAMNLSKHPSINPRVIPMIHPTTLKHIILRHLGRLWCGCLKQYPLPALESRWALFRATHHSWMLFPVVIPITFSLALTFISMILRYTFYTVWDEHVQVYRERADFLFIIQHAAALKRLCQIRHLHQRAHGSLVLQNVKAKIPLWGRNHREEQILNFWLLAITVSGLSGEL